MSSNRGKALVVDDAEDWRSELQEFLQGKGFETVAVGDKLSAQELLDTEAFDVAIIDVNLADATFNVDGFLINRHIQNNGIDTQVVLISARSLSTFEIASIQPAVFIEKSKLWEQLGPFLFQFTRDNKHSQGG
jgi:CheY-like chemotaxis protein